MKQSRTAVITGAAGGIGRAIARRFVEDQGAQPDQFLFIAFLVIVAGGNVHAGKNDAVEQKPERRQRRGVPRYREGVIDNIEGERITHRGQSILSGPGPQTAHGGQGRQRRRAGRLRPLPAWLLSHRCVAARRAVRCAARVPTAAKGLFAGGPAAGVRARLVVGRGGVPRPVKLSVSKGARTSGQSLTPLHCWGRC